MVSANTLLKNLLSVKNCVNESYKFVTNDKGVKTLKVYVHPHKAYSDICPVCGKRCSVYDRKIEYRMWRDLDTSNGIVVEIYSKTKRICCSKHGVKTASVPWSSMTQVLPRALI